MKMCNEREINDICCDQNDQGSDRGFLPVPYRSSVPQEIGLINGCVARRHGGKIYQCDLKVGHTLSNRYAALDEDHTAIQLETKEQFWLPINPPKRLKAAERVRERDQPRHVRAMSLDDPEFFEQLKGKKREGDFRHPPPLSKKRKTVGLKKQLQELSAVVDHQAFEMGPKISEVKNFFAQIVSTVKALQYPGSDAGVISNIISRLEDLGALIIIMITAHDVSAVACGILLYARTHTTQPWSVTLAKALTSLTENVTHQAGEYFTLFKQMVSAWHTVDSALIPKMCTLVDLLVVTGFCGEQAENWFTGEKKSLIEWKLKRAQKTSTSLVTLFLDTVMFFMERGLGFFRTGDWRYLLYGESEMFELDEEYNLLTSATRLIESGKIEELSSLSKGDSRPIRNLEDFDQRLDILESKILALLSSMKPDNPGRHVLVQKSGILKKFRVMVRVSQREECCREAPMTLMIEGRSSVGKSRFTGLAIMAMARGQGENSVTKRDICYQNDDDKYDTEYQPGHKYIVRDDVANMKPPYVETPPPKKIIQLCNNVPVTALKADVESKGAVQLRPKGVVITTNDKTLQASTYSVEPASIIRRMDLIITLKLKPEAMDQFGGPCPTFQHEAVPDMWWVEIAKPILERGAPGMPDTIAMYDMVASQRSDGTMKQTDVYGALRIIEDESRKKKRVQQSIVKQQLSLFDADLCPHYRMSEFCAECFKDCAPNYCDEFGRRHVDDPHIMKQVEEEIRVAALVRDGHMKPTHQSSGSDDESDDIEWLKFFAKRREIDDAFMVKLDQEDDLSSLVDVELVRTMSFREWWSLHAPHYRTIAWGCASTACAVGLILGIYSMMRPVIAQGSEENIVVPEKPVVNVWRNRAKCDLYPHKSSVSATVSDIMSKMWKLQGLFQYTSLRGTRMWTNICPLKGNVWVLPRHCVDDLDMSRPITLTATSDVACGRQVCDVISPENYFVFEGTDLAAVRIIPGGDVPDLAKWLPMKRIAVSKSAKLTGVGVYRDSELAMHQVRCRINQNVNIRVCGNDYDLMEVSYLDFLTSKGICGMPVVTETKTPVIAGFHVAGVTDTSQGYICTLTQSEVENATAYFANLLGGVALSSTEIPETQYDIVVNDGGDLSHKNPLNYVGEFGYFPGTPSYDVIATRSNGGTKLRTSVVQYPWSADISDIFPLRHGIPELNRQWRHYQNAHAHISVTMKLFPSDALSWAVEDYCGDVIDTLAKYDLRKMISPLPLAVNLSGVNGGFGGVDRNTSAGFPLNRPKNEFCERTGQPLIVGDGVVAITDVTEITDPRIIEQMELCENTLAAGERYNMIFKMTLKDEVKSLNKLSKIRVMSCCPFACTLVIRKYFVPIIDLLHNERIVYECAVGCNVHGPDWSEIVEYMKSFGDETAGYIAGDYKEYDKHQSSQLILAAFDIYLRIARLAGYDERQLKIMQGIAYEIAYPVYEMQGAILKACGSNPSGNPMTVELNSVGNSLIFRVVYYLRSKEMNRALHSFRSICRPTMYGDDNLAPVKKGHEDVMNNIAIHDTLIVYGMEYTAPDKDADLKPLYDFDEVSYLKRKMKFCSARNTWVAPLEIKSLSKAMHFCRKPTPPQDVNMTFRASVDGVFRELSYHGEEVYNEYRDKMLERLPQIGFPEIEIPSFTEQVAEEVTVDIGAVEFQSYEAPSTVVATRQDIALLIGGLIVRARHNVMQEHTSATDMVDSTQMRRWWRREDVRSVLHELLVSLPVVSLSSETSEDPWYCSYLCDAGGSPVGFDSVFAYSSSQGLDHVIAVLCAISVHEWDGFSQCPNVYIAVARARFRGRRLQRLGHPRYEKVLPILELHSDASAPSA